MKKIMIILSFLLLNSALYSNDNIEISIDLGGNKFPFLEILYAKIIVKNNMAKSIEIEKGNSYDGPYANFEIFDKQANKILPDHNPDDGNYDLEKTIYSISPNEKISFPLRGFYNLQYFMHGSNDFTFPYLKPGKYKVRCTMWIGREKILSDWLDFEVSNDQYAGLNQLINIAHKYSYTKDFIELEREWYKILEYDSVSTLSLRVMSYFSFLYRHFYDGSKEYLFQKEYLLLQKATKIFVNHHPNSRYAYNMVKNLIMDCSSDYLEEYAYDPIELLSILSNEINNSEIKKVLNRNIQIRKNEFSQPGLQIIKKKVKSIEY